jgi:DNA invertase Pin-like site-specific DNA recombinase
MTQRTALYARVSTTRQQEDRTVASQVAALEKAAESMGLVVAAEHRYVDVGGHRGARKSGHRSHDGPALHAPGVGGAERGAGAR